MEKLFEVSISESIISINGIPYEVASKGPGQILDVGKYVVVRSSCHDDPPINRWMVFFVEEIESTLYQGTVTARVEVVSSDGMRLTLNRDTSLILVLQKKVTADPCPRCGSQLQLRTLHASGEDLDGSISKYCSTCYLEGFVNKARGHEGPTFLWVTLESMFYDPDTKSEYLPGDPYDDDESGDMIMYGMKGR